MTIKDIVVHADWTSSGDNRVATAAAVARQFDARLTGLYMIEPAPAEARVPTDSWSRNRMATEAAALSAATEAHARDHFANAARNAGVAGEWHAITWHSNQTFAQRARYFDCAVVGQGDLDDPSDRARTVAVQTLLGSGRPILAIPYGSTYATVGSRVVVAWNNTPTCARALHYALPFLRSAKSVSVLLVNADWDGAEFGSFDPGASLVAYLEHHGIASHLDKLSVADITVSDIILNRCADVGADLLVAGGYGHAPVYERIFGGISRTLFKEMTLPILFAH
jgi:nucleotide-binding universal stress UspA family protein